MRGSVPSARYSPICNVLRQWKTSLIPIYSLPTLRYLPREGRPSLVEPTPRAMFRILSVTCLLTRKVLRLIIIPET